MSSVRKYKVLQIGAGLMGENWVNYLLKNKDVELVGLVDIDQNRLNSIKSKYNLSQTYIDLEFAVCDSKPDIILDVTPPILRERIAKIAAKYNCAVLAEKPLAISIKSAKKIIDIVEKSSIVYMVNQNYRWNPAINLIRANLSQIGKIKEIECKFAKSVKLDGFRTNINHPFVLDQAVHHFDLCRYILSDFPKTSYAVSINGDNSEEKIGLGCSAIFKFPTETVFNYSGTWNSKGIETSWSGFWTIFGEGGTITWDGVKKITKYFKGNNNKYESTIITDKETAKYNYEMCFGKSVTHLIQSLQTRLDPTTNPKDNILTLSMVESVILSSKTNSVILL